MLLLSMTTACQLSDLTSQGGPASSGVSTPEIVRTCRFSEKLEVYGSISSSGFKFRPEDETREETRCDAFSRVKPTLLSLEIKGQPIALQSAPAAQEFALGLRVVVTGDLFAPGSQMLKDSAASDVSQLAENFYRSDEAFYLVAGYTDSGGEYEVNRKLSLRRAAEFAEALVRSGVPRFRIAVVGRGEDYPLYENSGPRGHLNRRIEVFE
jgi:outer membrane protein OmpA-like peptidoglycan-associated protein